MDPFRAIIKDTFYKTKLAHVLDHILFHLARLKKKKKNLKFRAQFPDIIIPPDYFLYETYRLDYEHFINDGECTAKEILDWTKKYFKNAPLRILDWGCGVSRIVMHLHKYVDTSLIYACDINEEMILFNKQNYKGVAYSLVSYLPPTGYKNKYFDLLYGFSIFTHIEVEVQKEWIKEIHRILNHDGIFLFTTQGDNFYSKLLQKEKSQMDTAGVFTKTYRQKGHRMMSTYNSAKTFRNELEKYFMILEYHDGKFDKLVSGQDLWIVRKAT